MNIKISVHNDKFEKKLNDVQNWNIPESTKKEIREFIEKAKIGQINKGKKLSDRTLSKYLTLLRLSLELINKPTSKITREDIEKYDSGLSKKNLSSEADYKVNLKIFLNWKLGQEKTNKIAGWLDTRQKTKTPDYLTEREIERLYSFCKYKADKFLIAVLFDAGCRAEELLNIRFEDIELPTEQGQDFVKVTLKEEYSKTKGRVISLYWKNSLNAIREFLEERKNEGIKLNEPIFNKTYDATRIFLSRLGKKVLNKRIHPHLFRHSSATFYANKLNRQELCYRYGWAFSSTMPDVYISRAGMESKQLDEKFKSTELEDIQREFNKEKLEKDIKIAELEKQIENNQAALRDLIIKELKKIKH